MSYKITETGRSQETTSCCRIILSPLYSVQLYLVWSQKLHQKCILSAEFYKCRNADAKSHTYTNIPQLSSPFSLMLTNFLPLPRAFLSLSCIFFLILLLSLLISQRIRLNILSIDRNQPHINLYKLFDCYLTGRLLAMIHR